MAEDTRWRGVCVGAATGCLAVGLFLAALVNGGYGYLARIGVLQPQAYSQFLAAYCPATPAPSSRPTACWCMSPQTEFAAAHDLPLDYLFDAAGTRLIPKLAKEAWWLAFLAVSLYLLATRRARLPGRGSGWPLLLLAACLLLGWVLSASKGGALHASMGLRPFEFMAIAGLGGWAASGMRQTARWMAGLLLAQAILVGIELRYGLPLRACPNSFRAAGTMVLPNTLGIVAVSAFAFVVSFELERKWLAVLGLVTGFLVLASGSGTGLVMLFALLALVGLRHVPPRLGRLAAVALLLLGALLAAGLPVVTHRPDIYDSLFAAEGRVEKALRVVRANSAAENLFGRGLGEGTNASTNLSRLEFRTMQLGPPQSRPFYADSTITFLLMQLGFLGVALFYGLLGWAWRRDRAARPFYLVVAVASLTLNIPEVFPVNFLLGLALAASLARSGPQAAGEVVA